MVYYRQPKYFKDFKCAGSDCKITCCNSWRIDWTKDEIDKVKNAPDCSEELKALMDKTFVPYQDDKYKVAFTEAGNCPLLTEEGLCRVQRELGAEYLSETCTDYPRRRIVTGKGNYRVCHLSCPEVTKRLVSDEKAMVLVNFEVKNEGDVRAVCDNPEKIAANPALKYRKELLEFFYEIIGDKKHDIETSVILGALAAQSLSKLAENGQYDSIPQAIKQLKPQLHNGAQLKTIENIKPNYRLKLGFLSQILTNIAQFSMIPSLADETGTLSIDIYNSGERRLARIFENNDFWLRNIALSLIFELALPFKLTESTIFENYCVYVGIFACLKLNSIAAMARGSTVNLTMPSGAVKRFEGKECISGLTSIMCRELCQNEENLKSLLKTLQDNKFTSPAYLALLVK